MIMCKPIKSSDNGNLFDLAFYVYKEQWNLGFKIRNANFV